MTLVLSYFETKDVWCIMVVFQRAKNECFSLFVVNFYGVHKMCCESCDLSALKSKVLIIRRNFCWYQTLLLRVYSQSAFAITLANRYSWLQWNYSHSVTLKHQRKKCKCQLWRSSYCQQTIQFIPHYVVIGKAPASFFNCPSFWPRQEGLLDWIFLGRNEAFFHLFIHSMCNKISLWSMLSNVCLICAWSCQSKTAYLPRPKCMAVEIDWQLLSLSLENARIF